MRAAVLSAIIFASATQSLVADWPLGGRVPGRNPVSPDAKPPTDWQIGDTAIKSRNIAWSVPLGSRSSGGPVVSGGLVWVGTNNERPLNPKVRGDRAILACFRESDGKFLYQYASDRLEGKSQDWPKQSLSGSPLIDGKYIWFCTNRREVVCLDAGPIRKEQGEAKVVWKRDLVAEFGVHPRALMIPGAESHGSPIGYKEYIYVPTGNGMGVDAKTLPSPEAPAIVCLKKDTGKMVWKYAPPAKDALFGHYSSPLVTIVDGKAQVVMAHADGVIRAFEAATGKVIWQFDVNDKRGKREFRDKVYIVGTPVFVDGRIYFAVGLHPEEASGAGRLFCIAPTMQGGIEAVWEYAGEGEDAREFMHQSVSSVAVSNGLVIAVDVHGNVHCVDAKSGRRQWVHDTRERIICNPLIVDGVVFVATDGGTVWALELNRKKKVVTKVDMARSVVAPLIFANGVLFVLTEDHLYAIAAPKNK